MSTRRVFNLFAGRLPRAIPGDVVKASEVDAGFRATERAKPIPGFNTSASFFQTPAGFSQTVKTFPIGIGYVISIGGITKSTNAGYGGGKISQMYDNGTDLVPMGNGITVKNYHTVGFAINSTVAYFEALGSFWVFDVHNCSFLTT